MWKIKELSLGIHLVKRRDNFSSQKQKEAEKADEDGLNILIAFLDKHLGKDDFADNIEKFEDFDDFKRKEGQTIQEFIAMFDCKYRKIEKKAFRDFSL